MSDARRLPPLRVTRVAEQAELAGGQPDPHRVRRRADDRRGPPVLRRELERRLARQQAALQPLRDRRCNRAIDGDVGIQLLVLERHAFCLRQGLMVGRRRVARQRDRPPPHARAARRERRATRP